MVFFFFPFPDGGIPQADPGLLPFAQRFVHPQLPPLPAKTFFLCSFPSRNVEVRSQCACFSQTFSPDALPFNRRYIVLNVYPPIESFPSSNFYFPRKFPSNPGPISLGIPSFCASHSTFASASLWSSRSLFPFFLDTRSEAETIANTPCAMGAFSAYLLPPVPSEHENAPCPLPSLTPPPSCQ